MERLWCYIFTRNKILKEAFLDVILTKFERYNFQVWVKLYLTKLKSFFALSIA